MAWEVQTFGNDCLGNITGYSVTRNFGQYREIVGSFVGDIYRPESFSEAKAKAEAMRDKYNGVGRTEG